MKQCKAIVARTGRQCAKQPMNPKYVEFYSSLTNPPPHWQRGKGYDPEFCAQHNLARNRPQKVEAQT